MEFVLADGRKIRIRPICAADQSHLQIGLTKLGAQTRRLRFHTDRRTFTPQELEYLTACDGQDRIAVVAIGLDEAGEEFEGVGVARAYRDLSCPERGEVAMVVIDAWQGGGIGRHLMDELARRCLSVGIDRWTASVFGENRRALKLLASYGSITDRRWAQGVQEIVVDLIKR